MRIFPVTQNLDYPIFMSQKSKHLRSSSYMYICTRPVCVVKQQLLPQCGSKPNLQVAPKPALEAVHTTEPVLALNFSDFLLNICLFCLYYSSNPAHEPELAVNYCFHLKKLLLFCSKHNTNVPIANVGAKTKFCKYHFGPFFLAGPKT